MEDVTSQLETSTQEFAEAARVLAGYWNDATQSNSSSAVPFAVPSRVSEEVHRARRSALSNLRKLQSLIYEPSDFLQHLVGQNQLLACLHWLAEFQILAFVPLNGGVPTKDVADLAGVPDTQLCRVVRMTATAGFLAEPRPGYVAHTPLSAPFVSKSSYFDVVAFLAEVAGPAALSMAAATHKFGGSDRPCDSAFNLAFDASQTFEATCGQRPRLQRQWPAYLHHGTGDSTATLTEVLSRLDWTSLGSVTVVEVGARSIATATALCNLYPTLRFIVQANAPDTSIEPTPQSQLTPIARALNSNLASKAPDSRITLQSRTAGTPQTVQDAAVYILRLPCVSPTLSVRTILADTAAELRAHMGVLRANSNAMLILLPRLLPEPHTLDPDLEGLARSRDLTLLQLSNDREMEMSDLEGLLNTETDGAGRLVVVNKLRSRTNAVVALGVKYKGDCAGD